MCKVNPKIDIVFKKLFGVNKNKDLLLSLVNSVMSEEDKITDLTLKNPYNIPDYLSGKLSILDIKAEDEQGKQYNIEMQMVGHGDYGLRTLFYLAKSFIDQIGSGGKYRNLNKTIIINIVDFNFFKDKNEKRYHREIAFRDVKTLEKYIKLDHFSIHFVELPKYNEDKNKVKTTLERWMSFLNNAGKLTSSNLPNELATNEIKKAMSELNIMYFDKMEKEHYDNQQKARMDIIAIKESAEQQGKIEGEIKGRKEGEIKGRKEGEIKGRKEGEIKGKKEGEIKGRKEGEIKGKKEGRIEIAKQMKLENEPVDKIIRYTGLTKEQINKL